MKVPERRCQAKRTCAYLVDRVAARAICPRQGQTPLLPGVHLRIGIRNKNQIANSKRHQMATDMNFIERLGAHRFAPIAALISSSNTQQPTLISVNTAAFVSIIV